MKKSEKNKMFENPPVNLGKKILIIGLGQIGYSNAEYMTSLGLHVDGYDINKEAITRALNNKVIQKNPLFGCPKNGFTFCLSATTKRPVLIQISVSSVSVSFLFFLLPKFFLNTSVVRPLSNLS